MRPLLNSTPLFSGKSSFNSGISNSEEKSEKSYLKKSFTNNIFSEESPLLQSDEDSSYSGIFFQNEYESLSNSKEIDREITLEENSFVENENFSLQNFIKENNKEDLEKNEECHFLDEEKVVNKSILSSLDNSPKENNLNYNFNANNINLIPENILSPLDLINNQKNKIVYFHVKKNEEINNNLLCEPINKNCLSDNENFVAKKRNNSKSISNLINKEKNNLQKNSGNQQKIKSFLCECGKVFSTEENQRLHYINVHLHKKPFHCNYCKEEFSHRNGKIYHERVYHTFILPYNCMECSSAFASKSALAYHMKSKHKKF